LVRVAEGEAWRCKAVELNAARGIKAERPEEEGAANLGAIGEVCRILAVGVTPGSGCGAAEAAGADIAAADPELRGAERGRAQLAVHAHRIARAIFSADPARTPACKVRVGRGDRHHPADRLAAPGQAVRAAQNLDTVDAPEHQIGKIERTVRR